MMRLPATFVLHTYRSPSSPARVVRKLRGPSLADAVAGRVVVVTGASSGIGRATALRVGAAGATVLLVARTVEALEEVAGEIRDAGGIAHVHPCDLRDPEAVDRLAAEISERYGGVDVLVNNAGRSIRRPIDESYERFHDFERTMRLNYFAALQLILGLLPAMRERGSGHIVNVSTMGVQTKAPRYSAYIASKAALDAFSSCLAAEARADGVRVTSVQFPLVHTPMVAPSGVYDQAPGLTAEEAADTIAEAITTKPTRMSARLGLAFQAAWLVAPSAVQSVLSAAYRRSVADTAGDASNGGAPRSSPQAPAAQPHAR